MAVRFVCGGVGDLLLTLESAFGDKYINVFSHFSHALDFYRPFDVLVDTFTYFPSLKEFHSLSLIGEALPRAQYPRIPLPKASIMPPNTSCVIGIHIEGSKFSNEASKQSGRPIKDMSPNFVGKLIDVLSKAGTFSYIFCAPSRRNEVDALLSQKNTRLFRMVAFEDIWDSLACVSHCQRVIAVDSCIKTMAAILRIPTVVLAADYPDPFRDAVFLTPYVNDGIMRIVKYVDIDFLNPSQIVDML
jgi:ADP-heptose:LPS heptosyltransferase